MKIRFDFLKKKLKNYIKKKIVASHQMCYKIQTHFSSEKKMKQKQFLSIFTDKTHN